MSNSPLEIWQRGPWHRSVIFPQLAWADDAGWQDQSKTLLWDSDASKSKTQLADAIRGTRRTICNCSGVAAGGITIGSRTCTCSIAWRTTSQSTPCSAKTWPCDPNEPRVSQL